MERKVIYYKDELNDEFSEAKIVPRKIDGSYVYIHKNPLWNIASYILQNILSMPIKLIYAKCKLRIKYIGKENFKRQGKQDILYMQIIHKALQTPLFQALQTILKEISL